MIDYIAIFFKNYCEHYQGLPRKCWYGILLLFIVSIAIGISFFLSLYLVNYLHFDMVETGIILSCYGGGTIFGSFIASKCTDKFDPKLLALFNLFILSIAFVLLVKLKTLSALMLDLFVMGSAIFCFVAANDVWMLAQCDEASLRLKVINVSRVGLNLGWGLTGALIGFLAESEFHAIFYSISGILVILSLYFLFKGEEKKRNIKAEIVNTATVTQNNKVIILMLFCLFSVGLMIAQLGTTYPIYVQHAFGMTGISILFVLDTILIVMFQAPLIQLLQGYNRVLMAGIGALLMGVGLFILIYAYSFMIAILSCVIWAIGEMLFLPMAQSICYERSQEHSKGKMMGLYQTVYASSKLIGPLTGGMVFQYFGGAMLWSVCAMISVICLLGCLRFKKYV